MGLGGEGACGHAKEHGLDPKGEVEPLFVSTSLGSPHFHFFWSLLISSMT